jgi:iron complex outermembrane receptor protein
MNTRILSVLAATASVVAIIPTMPAMAQSSAQPSATGETGLEEVVVTARRREEKAQSVPITLLTFSPEILAKQDIRDPLTLTDSIPGLNGATGGSLGLTYTFLRGAPGVIFYWDQVPINANNQDQGFYFDISNIQVLYGPQGTLFGLSNDAGAVLFEPQHPKNDFEGYGQVTFGDYGRETVEGVINVPVIEDKLVVRIGGQYNKQDGYQHVIQQNINLLNQNYWDFRGSANFTPSDDFSNEFMLNYFDTQYLPGAYTFDGFNPGPAQAFGAPLQTILTYGQLGYLGPAVAASLAGKDVNLAQLLAQQRALGPYTLEALAFVPTAILKQLNIVDTASWDINDEVTIKNIAGYQSIFNYSKADIGGLNFGLLNGPTPIQSTPSGPTVQYNEELQLVGNFFDNKLNLQAGFFNQWGQPSQGGVSNTTKPYGIVYTSDFGGVSVTGLRQTQTSRTDALYEQGTYNLSDYVEGLSFTGGFRYTWDKFYTQENSYSAAGVYLPPTCINGAGKSTTVGCSTSQSARFQSPSYSIQLNYQVLPQTMLYINNSLGYKTGGFNGQNFAAFQIYKPEHLNNYEAGIKTDFDLGLIGMESVKARVDTSAFYGVYRGIEIQTTGAYLTGAGVESLGTPYLDVGDGDIYGWDFQFTLLPIPDLELHGDAEYNKGKYKNFQGPNAAGTGQTSVPGVAFEILPEYKFHGDATYTFSFIDKAYGEVSLTGTYSWVQHSVNTDVANATYYDLLPGHHNIDMSLDWKDILGYGPLSGRVFVTNLTQNTVVNGCLCAYHAIGEIGFQPAQPRMWGVTLRYEFGPESPEAAPATAYVPPPVAAPAPAPSVAHSYMVFFDFNKSDLSPQAVAIVDQAAKNAAPAKATELVVTGHTDTVGSEAYNMRLSRRRAESVAAELEKQGIASSEIEIVAKGKHDLLVPTGDGVREPQNRRVTIVYGGAMS